jgi:hypothetical protein
VGGWHHVSLTCQPRGLRTESERRLRERGLNEVELAVNLLSNTLTNQPHVTEQGRAVLDVVQRYTRAWRPLLEYDEDRLATNPAHRITVAAQFEGNASRAIELLRVANLQIIREWE